MLAESSPTLLPPGRAAGSDEMSACPRAHVRQMKGTCRHLLLADLQMTKDRKNSHWLGGLRDVEIPSNKS
jgi:hypothetical protein